jgi:hypothetical protein
MGATQADLSLGEGPEIARPAVRPRLAGEAGDLHKKQVPRARGPQAASWLRSESTHSDLNFRSPKLLPLGFMLSIIVGLLSLLRLGSGRAQGGISSSAAIGSSTPRAGRREGELKGRRVVMVLAITGRKPESRDDVPFAGRRPGRRPIRNHHRNPIVFGSQNTF